MTPVIRISDSVYKKLEAMAKGFDSPQNVIERLINDVEERQGNQMDNAITTDDIDDTITTDDAERRTFPTRQNITLDVIKEIYPIAKDVFDRKYHIDDAVDRLVSATDMNRSSAQMHIYVFQQMMKGECYKRAINGTATRHFLEKISNNFEKEDLEKAISAVNQHIEYREKSGHGNFWNLRAIAEEFSQKL